MTRLLSGLLVVAPGVSLVKVAVISGRVFSRNSRFQGAGVEAGVVSGRVIELAQTHQLSGEKPSGSSPW